MIMLDFDIERFVRKYMTKRPESLLAADFAKYSDRMHAAIDGRKMLVIGGAGTIGSNYVKAALRQFRPAAIYVVDIDENQLTELTRELRSGSEYTVPETYVTEPIDLGSRLFEKFFKAHGPFDIVANFAARKHVRAERDVHSIEAMCETNVFMAKKLLDLLLENPPAAFFCVSTDKAANPVNVMGATKKLMEETIMAYADQLPIKTARFANVAFSNGSLPIGWLNRIAKHQPLSCPLGIRRFFVSPIESGELCLAASVLAESGDIVYPKLDETRDMIPFDAVVKDMLNDMGLGCLECSSTGEAMSAMKEINDHAFSPPTPPSSTSKDPFSLSPFPFSFPKGYPVEFFGSDTDGEKTFEEFYTSQDEKDETTFVNLGVVKNAKRRPVEEVEAIFANLHAVFDRPGSTKDDVVEALKEYLPNFHHISKGKSLDGRM
ncbi:MAG: polysaccharide biosynthesis protein [bacterium]|nr:polysaccharide biosynthesis protein [bacterium]